MLGEASDGCALGLVLVGVTVVVAGMPSVVLVIAPAAMVVWLGKLGRYSSSGMSTDFTASTADSRSLSGVSGVSASAANGLGVPIVDAVGVTIFGLSFITLVLLVVLYFNLVMLKNKTHYMMN